MVTIFRQGYVEFYNAYMKWLWFTLSCDSAQNACFIQMNHNWWLMLNDPWKFDYLIFVEIQTCNPCKHLKFVCWTRLISRVSTHFSIFVTKYQTVWIVCSQMQTPYLSLSALFKAARKCFSKLQTKFNLRI